MKRSGVEVHTNTSLEKVTKDETTGKSSVHSKAGDMHTGFDVVLMAIGEISDTYVLELYMST